MQTETSGLLVYIQCQPIHLCPHLSCTILPLSHVNSVPRHQQVPIANDVLHDATHLALYLAVIAKNYVVLALWPAQPYNRMTAISVTSADASMRQGLP